MRKILWSASAALLATLLISTTDAQQRSRPGAGSRLAANQNSASDASNGNHVVTLNDIPFPVPPPPTACTDATRQAFTLYRWQTFSIGNPAHRTVLEQALREHGQSEETLRGMTWGAIIGRLIDVERQASESRRTGRPNNAWWTNQFQLLIRESASVSRDQVCSSPNAQPTWPTVLPSFTPMNILRIQSRGSATPHFPVNTTTDANPDTVTIDNQAGRDLSG